jgi:outer membrane receptor protein involved in Fe transport
VTVSGRWNRTRIRISDLTGVNPDLNGQHTFSRFNPAAGLTYQITPGLNVYGGYSESTRAPTPVELTCSDEDAPCKLPNQFLADPPLKQVVAHGWELGLRGNWQALPTFAASWHAGVFTTANEDDILFQVTGGASSNEGFFANAGNTRRRGFEASVEAFALDDRLHPYASYTYLDATYRTGFLETSANHPAANDAGVIEVSRGDHIPGLPKHAFKVGADFEFARRFSVGGEVVRSSGQYLRSDEANLLPRVNGFTVVNLRAQLALNRYVTLFGRMDNIFDRKYATFGTLGEPAEMFDGFEDARFLSPGTPRAGWAGVRIAL